MKSILKLSGKLILTFIATSVVAFITMMMCLSANIELAIKIAAGVLFIMASITDFLDGYLLYGLEQFFDKWGRRHKKQKI